MRFTTAVTCAAALFSSSAFGLNILINNDDGFGSAQIRELYRLLKKAGHKAVIVAPVDNESGMGGRSVFTTSSKLQVPSEFNLIPAGAPSIGHDPMDSHIWYYNGTPAACTFVGLDYVLPKHFPEMSPPDLLVAGPNFGNNLGPFLYTLSGTVGATYAAIGRGIPGIAFSGGNTEQRSYLEINKTTPTGLKDPATITAQLSVDVVQAIIKGLKPGDPVLPRGYGVSINSPYITSLDNKTCVDPKFVQTRMTGGAFSDQAIFNSTSGLFTFANILGPGINKKLNGPLKLPGETNILDSGCQTSMTVFSVDYDAPAGDDQRGIRKKLEKIAGDGVKDDSMLLSERELEERHTLRQV